MGNQISFSEIEFQNKRKQTKKEIFFAKMEKLVPLGEWCEIIRPYYYEYGNGRQPIQLEIMLKMYLVSQWYNLSDPETEDILNENLAARSYVGITGSAPDETTLCKFRHMLEANKLNEKIFAEFNKQLEKEEIIIKKGTIVDATIIDAPNSRKNADKKPTPEMGSTYKRNQYYYGMKAHIGVDKDSGIVHSLTTTAANVRDIEAANSVLHGKEEEIYGDAGFIGIEKRVEICEKYQTGNGEIEWLRHSRKRPPYLVCKKKEGVKFLINQNRSKVTTPEQKEEERKKSVIRAKVEHAFCIIKHYFKFRKTRYRTLAKNKNKLLMLFTLANVLLCARRKVSAS